MSFIYSKDISNGLLSRFVSVLLLIFLHGCGLIASAAYGPTPLLPFIFSNKSWIATMVTV
jgi:hypothetical protein